MKKTNKNCNLKTNIYKDNKITDNNNYINNNIKKEKIIKDLKLKGFNQRQITDIFETFISNTIDKEILNSKKEENHHSIQVNNYINNNLNNNLIFAFNQNMNKKNIKAKSIRNSYSRDNLFKKNSSLLKTDNSELNLNKKNYQSNYLKIYINAPSSKKIKRIILVQKKKIKLKK